MSYFLSIAFLLVKIHFICGFIGMICMYLEQKYFPEDFEEELSADNLGPFSPELVMLIAYFSMFLSGVRCLPYCIEVVVSLIEEKLSK